MLNVRFFVLANVYGPETVGKLLATLVILCQSGGDMRQNGRSINVELRTRGVGVGRIDRKSVSQEPTL